MPKTFLILLLNLKSFGCYFCSELCLIYQMFHLCFTISGPGDLSTTLNTHSTASILMPITDQLPSPTSSSYPSCLHQSAQGYSTALGVVSVLLVISLVGNTIYTIVVCVQLRVSKKAAKIK